MARVVILLALSPQLSMSPCDPNPPCASCHFPCGVDVDNIWRPRHYPYSSQRREAELEEARTAGHSLGADPCAFLAVATPCGVGYISYVLSIKLTTHRPG